MAILRPMRFHVSELSDDRVNDVNDYLSEGDTVKVKYKITEGATTRIQVFIGVVIARTKSFSNYNATFTVRKMSGNIGVERKFTLYSPLIAGIEISKQGVVRRAKLYYLRNLTGKASRIKEKLDFVSLAKSSNKEETKKAKETKETTTKEAVAKEAIAKEAVVKEISNKENTAKD
jgi:large subunit ribosomal protein L19